jgi:hypothetical protein
MKASNTLPFIFVSVLLTSCGGSESGKATTENIAPIADAGQDQNLFELSNVQLDAGGSSDNDGSISSYKWSQVPNTSPSVVIVDATSVKATFDIPNITEDTVFELLLTVVDNEGSSKTDQVTITAQAYLSVIAQSVTNNDDITVVDTISFTFNKNLSPSTLDQISFTENEIDLPVQTTVESNILTVSTIGGLRFTQSYELVISGILAIDDSPMEELINTKFNSSKRADGFFVGGVIIDGIINALYDDKWTTDFLLDSLVSNGLENFRLGTTTAINERLEIEPVSNWNNLWKNSYWSSREYNAYILEKSTDKSSNNSIFLFLSSGATHASTYDTNNEWDDLNKADLLIAVEKHAKETAQYFIDKGLSIHQYEIGNEIDFGIAGYSPGKKGVPSDIDLFNEANIEVVKDLLWIHHVDVLKAGIAGIKAANPEAKIAIHLAAMAYSENNSYPLNFYKYLISEGVQFDVIGLSYPYLTTPNQNSLPRPYFKSGEFNDFIRNISTLDKEIQISEFSYNYDEDSVQNTPSIDYPVTPQGQAAFIRDFLTHLSTYPKVSGAYYFYPDYYKNMNGYDASSIGLFSTPSMPQPALDEIYKFSIDN